MKIYIIHENEEWLPPFRDALNAKGLPFVEWHITDGKICLTEVPPLGVFFSRMSASAHTRGHSHAPIMTEHLFRWLEMHNRRIINGSSVLKLEMSKIAQYAALQVGGITTPRTVAVVGKANILKAAENFGELPFILKPNRGGKGLGVQLFQNIASLASYLDSMDYEEPVDGTWLIQQYIRAENPFITRMEFIDSRFHYAVKVDTSSGFELCPSDACDIEDVFCPVSEQDSGSPGQPSFQIIENFSDPLIDRLERVLKANQIEVAGVEFIKDAEGRTFVYDINTNTNYNNAAERRANIPETAPARLARFLGHELDKIRTIAAE